MSELDYLNDSQQIELDNAIAAWIITMADRIDEAAANIVASKPYADVLIPISDRSINCILERMRCIAEDIRKGSNNE